MSDMKFCRLCGSSRLVVRDSVPAAKLQSCYAFDTRRFFPSAEVVLLGCLDCGVQLYDDALPGDADFYDRLQAIPRYYDGDKTEFEHALAVIAAIKPASVLDVGAGCGLFLRKLLRMPSLRVRASELSAKSLAALRQAGISIDTAGDRYDMVCSFQVFEHLSDLRSMMSFVDEKLLAGGHLLVSVPNPESPLFRETFAYLDYPPHHMNRFSKSALESVGRLLGYLTIDYWQEALRIEHLSAVVKSRRRKMLENQRLRWLQLHLGTVGDSIVLPMLLGRGGEIGHSHTMVFRKPA
jgi:2-polyprenyl-3-methyl-5-hydroxy-6-metoxy-1,4-benzoquinol methylase